MLEDMFTRIKNGETRFIEMLMEQYGCTEAEATKVLNLFVKHKIARIDSGVGQVIIKHGAFLEPGVIQRAIDF